MDIDLLRNQLGRRRADLDAILRSTADHVKPVELDQVAVGRLSRMDALERQAVAKASRQSYLAEQRRIDAAIARIDDGEYGLCIACGEEIAPRRLEADPTASLCLSCARGNT